MIAECVSAVRHQDAAAYQLRDLGSEPDSLKVCPVALLRRHAGRRRESPAERNEHVEIEMPRVLLQVRRDLDPVGDRCGERAGAPA
jgi:hypothetical protein